MRRTFRTRAVPNPFLLLVAGFLIAAVASPTAQRRRGGGGDGEAPLATNTIAQNPEAYYGKPVTVSAGVEKILSKTEFLVDQRKVVAGVVTPVGAPLLVVAPSLTGEIDQKNYLLIRGQLTNVGGRPVLMATSVINSKYKELARKPLAPPTPAELSLMTAMKTISPAFAAMRAAIQASKAEDIRQSAATLAPALDDAEVIWDNIGQSPAAQWTREARAKVSAIERAAAAGSWDVVKLSSGELNTLCQTCHAVYRERQEDGTFRITPGTY